MRKNLNGYVCVAAAAISLVTGSQVLPAQSARTDALAGTVTNSTGAVIPNATVVVTNTDINQSRTTTTGNDGTYQFALLPGRLPRAVERRGFQGRRGAFGHGQRNRDASARS